MNIQPVTSNSFNITGYTLTSAYNEVDPGLFFDYGYNAGVYAVPSFGAITPATYLGHTISALLTDIIVNVSVDTTFVLVGILPQNIFTTLEANSIILTSASATFVPGSGLSVWNWSGVTMFAAAQNYTVLIN
jgi:hypothetical protein